MIDSGLAPLARAASTNSNERTWVVIVSEMRTIGGMKVTVSARMVLPTPEPSMPQMAMASRIDGKA